MTGSKQKGIALAVVNSDIQANRGGFFKTFLTLEETTTLQLGPKRIKVHFKSTSTKYRIYVARSLLI